MNNTPEKILSKALELFNQKGIEYVGMRELAAALGLRVGNLTYYFPTKDELVFRLTEQYSASNSRIHTESADEGLYGLLKKTQRLFTNQVGYRSLMLSMVHLMEQNPMIARQYEQVKQQRKEGLDRSVQTLLEEGYIRLRSEDDHWLLVSTSSLINRFWLSEAALSGNRHRLEDHLGYYLKMVAHVFKPYATSKGLRDIERFLQEWS